MPGPASLEVLSTFMSNEDIERPAPGGVWEYHGAYNAWYPGEHESWLYPSVCRRYFGEARDTAQLIEQGQLLQSEGYRAIYEEVRRQKPRAGMALAWCLNEPWPTSANNSIISWPDKPKPAYEAVKLACRPTLLSAKLTKYLWRAGELFAVDLWLLHDGPTGLPAGNARAKVRLGDRVIDLGTWSYGDVRPNQNVTGPTLRALLPDVPSADRMVLCLESDEGAFDSVYTLAYKSRGIDLAAEG
jgi:beta-mannosidase